MSNSGIFLCHATEDKVRVRDLYQKLRLLRFDPWLDEKHILPGKEWDNEIKQALHDSACVIVCLSRNSISKRGYVQKEITLALDIVDELPEGEVFIIPTRLENCEVPKRLSKWQWVDLFDPTGFQKLVSTLAYIKKSTRKQSGIFDMSPPVPVIQLSAQAEEYLQKLFIHFVWKRLLGGLELSAFASICRECGIDDPISKLKLWSDDFEENAADKLGTRVEQMAFLEIDFTQSIDYLPFEDSFFILFKSANDRNDRTTLGSSERISIERIGIALVAIVGWNHAQALHASWSELLILLRQ